MHDAPRQKIEIANDQSHSKSLPLGFTGPGSDSNHACDRFKVEDFAAYRTKRLAAGTQKNSINREHAYLRSVFNELRRLGFWKRDNPLSNVRQFKVADRELSFLTNEQIEALLAELKTCRNPHAYLIAKLCLSTGARWSEAESVTIRHVKNNQAQYGDTKSGRVRAVPIDDALQKELREHHDPKETEDRLFGPAYGAFRDAVDRIGLDLPEGQSTHVLRHTFASHFMMNGGKASARGPKTQPNRCVDSWLTVRHPSEGRIARKPA